MYSPLNKFKKLVKILFSIPEYIYTRFLYKQPKLKSSFVCLRYLIADQDDFEHVSRAYGGIFPEKTESKISEAEKVCEHIFDLLGSGATKLSPGGDGYQPIDWHADFVSGFRWNPRKPSVHIQYGVTKGADIKLPWELSRFQHLNILGQAYLLTKNRKYAEEFEGPSTLYRALGSDAEKNDFGPIVDALGDQTEITFGPPRGRSSETSALPLKWTR